MLTSTGILGHFLLFYDAKFATALHSVHLLEVFACVGGIKVSDRTNKMCLHLIMK